MTSTLGPLGAGLPLPELVAEREDALLGAGLLLIALAATEDRIELVLLDGVEQGYGLQSVARRIVARLLAHAALIDALDAGDDEPLAQLDDTAVAELEHLGKVVPGVDVHDREWELGRTEGLLGDAQQDDRVLPPRKSTTGRSNSAATSRMMNIDSASRAARWLSPPWIERSRDV